MNTSGDKESLLDLLARWQAFSEMQQRAFTFLAAEAIATGADFESSTEGAAQVLGRMGGSTSSTDTAEIKAETYSVIHSLQSADRSRQGLEQVAAVLETLRRLEAELTEETRSYPPLPPVDEVVARWSRQLDECVTLSDWRRRFAAVLAGRDPGPRTQAASDSCDEELFF
jgi:hypothetical protein